MAAGVFVAGQSVDPDLADLMRQTEYRLNTAFAADIEGTQFKKVEIKLTNDGFFRYRRTFLNGKQEYFSFHFSQFEDLEYLGTTHLGFLVMKTKPESIIVQTFRDSKGNIDTMATELRVPLKDMDVADIQAFQMCFSKIHEKLKQP
ncbi:MAG: hypothetical protein ACKOW2_08485 [Sphingobacteriaceae bacterium]